MSLKAMTWALHDAPVDDAQQLLILWALADRAHDDGTSAWPSQAWLADKARCSDRTVRRHLKTLEDAGLITRGEQRLVEHLPHDRRPVVWDLSLWMKRPDNLSGRTQVTERPDTGDRSGRTPVSDEPSLEPSRTTTSPSPVPHHAREAASRPRANERQCPVCDAWHGPGAICAGTVPVRPGALREAFHREQVAS